MQFYPYVQNGVQKSRQSSSVVYSFSRYSMRTPYDRHWTTHSIWITTEYEIRQTAVLSWNSSGPICEGMETKEEQDEDVFIYCRKTRKCLYVFGEEPVAKDKHVPPWMQIFKINTKYSVHAPQLLFFKWPKSSQNTIFCCFKEKRGEQGGERVQREKNTRFAHSGAWHFAV